MPSKSIISLIVLLVATTASADIVQYDLNFERFFWPKLTRTVNFDLGTEFTEISHIYLQWSGSIKAVEFEPIIPLPNFQPYYDGYFKAQIYDLGSSSASAAKSIYGGADTAPDRLTFDLTSELNMSNYSPFLDGVGSVKISFDQEYPFIWYMDIKPIRIASNASGRLDNAMLIFEGTVIPEPTTIMLLTLGALFLRQKK